MLVRYKDFYQCVAQKLPPKKGKQLCPTRDGLLELCGDKKKLMNRHEEGQGNPKGELALDLKRA